MADTTDTSHGATEPAGTEPEKAPDGARTRWGGVRRKWRDATPGTDEQTAGGSPPAEGPGGGSGPGAPSGDKADREGQADVEAGPDERSDAAPEDRRSEGAEQAEDRRSEGSEHAEGSDEGGDEGGDPDELPCPTRVGWVVAAFLFFWPLAIAALVQSMRTAEANGTGNARRAKKASVRTLDFSLGAVTVGVLGIAGLWVAIAAAPTYASSLPPGLVATARSFVPPALEGPLGITLPDDGPAVAEPSYSPTPADDPYATADPYATNPYEDPADASDLLPTPGSEGLLEPSGEPAATSDTAATAGAEIPDLQVGDCIDTAATSGQTTLYRIPVVPCTTAHGGEIYAETTAQDSLAENGQSPTQQALWDAADAYCYPQFTEYVGLRWARSELLYWPIAPSEESWADGDRRILCVVESEQPVTGTLKGADR